MGDAMGAQSFDGAEKAKTFAGFFEVGEPMWAKMFELAAKAKASPANILDLGAGPGEPACYFAAKFPGVPVTCTDLAPPMVELAKKRAAAKGLKNVECAVVDMQNQSGIPDASVDLVISQMAYQFCPDKPKALAETFRVMKPGGVLVANVWNSMDLMPLAGGLMKSVTGPTGPPPPNPNGPLGLADAALFDSLLADAGFKTLGDHNYSESVKFRLGPIDDVQSFKMTMLPLWDKFTEFEADGTHPNAWATALAAFPEVAKPFADADGVVYVTGNYRVAVVQKPA